jgi:hypothetical protein
LKKRDGGAVVGEGDCQGQTALTRIHTGPGSVTSSFTERNFSSFEVAGAMAKGGEQRGSSLARHVSHSPSCPSAHDWAHRPCFGGMRAR